MSKLYGLQERLENVERFWENKLASFLPVDRLRLLGGYSVLGDLLKKLAINCVLDVGANRGQYGMELRQLGYRGWILSFEPIKTNFDVLEDIAKRNGPWRVFQYALGATNGKSAINVMERTVFSSFLTPKEDSQTRFPWNRVKRRDEVEIRRLDNILETCLFGIESPRIYLKMDTQGFDLEVMRGAESTLSIVLALQTEVSFRKIYMAMPGFIESLQEFQTRGFDVVDFLPVTSEGDGLCAIEMDCIMARRSQ
jgi:FkbM family methyltransferase